MLIININRSKIFFYKAFRIILEYLPKIYIFEVKFHLYLKYLFDNFVYITQKVLELLFNILRVKIINKYNQK